MTITYKDLLNNISLSINRCWEWKGKLNPKGYGYVWHEGKTWEVHRLAYIIFSGDENVTNYEIHHKCNNKKCINPIHLEKLTYAQHNIKRDMSNCGAPKKNFCKRGHPLTEDNLIYKKQLGVEKRTCKICKRNSDKEGKLGRKNESLNQL